MKFVVALLLMCLGTVSLSQFSLEPIEGLKDSKSQINVVMISADWCNICRVNETKIEQKKYLGSFNSDQVRFFKLREKHADPIVFNGKSYSYQQTGLNQGVHELISHFLGGKQPTYPTFLFMDFQNKVVESWPGFISEPEMESLLNGILNQIEEPDSDNSN